MLGSLFLHFALSLFSLNTEELESTIQKNISNVAEFEFIRAEAKKMGIRVFIFGGTAASFANYVKWDVQRLEGNNKFSALRFDYHFCSIFRPEQDIDLVVDGSRLQADQLRDLLVKKAENVYAGRKSKWDIRLLNGRFEDRYGLLDDKDFQNQHSDSQSTGLIEISETSNLNPFHIRDARAWDILPAPFLNDLVAEKNTYYFSPSHNQTSRAREGLNPPIFSVIRFLTKTFQFGLKIDPQDEKILREIVDSFYPESIHRGSYAWRWMKKNITNMIYYSIDLERTYRVLKEWGLDLKLIDLDPSSDAQSLKYILGRVPLPSLPLGTEGRTAKELQITEVKHMTKGLDAYDSISRSPHLEANVFISRVNQAHESALYGSGFYTAIKSAEIGLLKGTGFALSFKVDPQAREGRDFFIAGNIVLFKNKTPLKLIPKAMAFTAADVINAIVDQSNEDWLNTDEAFSSRIARRLDVDLTRLTLAEEIAYRKALRRLGEFLAKSQPDRMRLFENLEPLMISEKLTADIARALTDYLLRIDFVSARSIIDSGLQHLHQWNFSLYVAWLKDIKSKFPLSKSSVGLIQSLKLRGFGRLLPDYLADISKNLAWKLDSESDAIVQKFIQDTQKDLENQLRQVAGDKTLADREFILDGTRLDILSASLKYSSAINTIIQNILPQFPAMKVAAALNQILPLGFIPHLWTLKLLVSYGSPADYERFLLHLAPNFRPEKISAKEASQIFLILLEKIDREISFRSIYPLDNSDPIKEFESPYSLRKFEAIYNRMISYLGLSKDSLTHIPFLESILERASESLRKSIYQEIFRFEQNRARYEGLSRYFQNWTTEDPSRRKPANTLQNHKRLIDLDLRERDDFISFVSKNKNHNSLVVKAMALFHKIRGATDRDEPLKPMAIKLFREIELAHPSIDWLRDLVLIEDREIRMKLIEETMQMFCISTIADLASLKH